jgi:hypothetical protein
MLSANVPGPRGGQPNGIPDICIELILKKKVVLTNKLKRSNKDEISYALFPRKFVWKYHHTVRI